MYGLTVISPCPLTSPRPPRLFRDTASVAQCTSIIVTVSHECFIRGSLWHSCCQEWTSETVSWQDCPRANLTDCSQFSMRQHYSSSPPVDQATALATRLTWLSVPERVEFKLCPRVSLPPWTRSCLLDSCDLKSVSNTSSQHRLRSASTTALVVPATRRFTLCDHVFPVAAARTWNELPHKFTAPSLSSLWRLLTTHLFRRSSCSD